MDLTSKIFIAGRGGMAGSAVERAFRAHGYQNIIGASSKTVDLRCEEATDDYFSENRPEYVILCAAKVGGILANSQFPADFLIDNLRIQNNVILCCQKYGVKKLLFLASSCIYPRLAPQPMREEYLLTGPLEPTNEGYALAKIAGLKLCEYLNKQYKTNFIGVLPCNLYGFNDNFHPEHSHFIPALLRRFHLAKVNGSPNVTVWGTGKARRELMFSDDLAQACVFLMEQDYRDRPFINIGTGVDHTIAEIAQMIREIVGYEGGIVFDREKPDGMPQKLMDVSVMNQLGWQASTSLESGLRQTYEYYLKEIFPKEQSSFRA